jgi:hypothetical protein
VSPCVHWGIACVDTGTLFAQTKTRALSAGQMRRRRPGIRSGSGTAIPRLAYARGSMLSAS